MISVSAYRYLRMLIELALFILLSFAVLGLLSAVQAQKIAPKAAQPAALPAAQTEEPLLREYRGVRIGMPAEAVRQKLGTPVEPGDRQDYYVFSEKESAQIFYDAQKNVMAVSVNYFGTGSGAPTAQQIFGTAAEARPDGSAYKLVRYQRAGYWVAYNATGGDAPLVTVVMQKMID